MPFRNKQDWRSRRETCAFCGGELTGEQVLFCSDNCRAKHRYHRNKPRSRNCEVCGEPMNLRVGNPRRKRCSLGTGPNADAGPGDECWELQNEADARRNAEKDARDFPLCAHCGEETEYAGTGRHRKYCSDRCRVAAYRARKRAASLREHPTAGTSFESAQNQR